MGGKLHPSDQDWIRRALALAVRGLGSVEPNPLVGAVIVRDGQLIGEGWHERYGGPHAEIQALRSASQNPKGSTVFVTLEPCCHHGKTPPCTDALIKAGIQRVVYGLEDPFPKVSGAGIAQLQAVGIEVTGPVLGEESAALLAPYLMLITNHRPWVIVKTAVSLDGKTATVTHNSKWITGETARKHAHHWRGRVDAIVIGIGTALADNPMLTARPSGPREAVRVVFDRSGKLASGSVLVRTAKEVPVVVVTTTTSSPEWREEMKRSGVEVWMFDQNQISSFLREAGTRSWTRVLVEGGGGLAGSFLDAGFVDELHHYQAPILIGGCSAPSGFMGNGCQLLKGAWKGRLVEQSLLGPDLFRRFIRSSD